MFLKLLHWIGIIACIAMIGCCFLPWTYYPDIDSTFTGFFSKGDYYGEPGVLLSILAAVSLICQLVPKVWAKRTNLFVCALALGYAIKTYWIYTSCYEGVCPDKRAGIFIML